MSESQNLTNSSADIAYPAKLLEAKKDVITRFIDVIVPLRDLYQLPPTSVHVFYDLTGSTVAFYCNAGIFLNLRYYEAWRMPHFLCLCHLRSLGFEQMTTKLRAEISLKLISPGNRSSLSWDVSEPFAHRN